MRSRTGGLCCVKFHVGKLPNGTLDVRVRHTCCLIRTHAARLRVPPARTKIAWPRNVAIHNRIIDSLRGAIVPRQPRKERAPTYAATVSGSPPSPTTTAELPTPTAAAAAAASRLASHASLNVIHHRSYLSSSSSPLSSALSPPPPLMLRHNPLSILLSRLSPTSRHVTERSTFGLSRGCCDTRHATGPLG